jgi:beta-lactamase class D
MNRKFRLLILALAACSCFASAVIYSTPSAMTKPNEAIATSVQLGALHESNFSKHFQDLGITGSIAIYDLNADRFYEYNPERNTTAFSPASTFKILNSLIALETTPVKVNFCY